MPTRHIPPLGSLALQGPSPHLQTVHVSPSTCYDLSLFKEILREYRRLDDTITMRLNRANATMRDQQREHDTSSGENIQSQACAYLWRELVENWKRRTQLVQYCTDVVDRSLTEKREALEDQSGDPGQQRKTQAAIYADQVKRNQVHNELTVENIVRKRAVEALASATPRNVLNDQTSNPHYLAADVKVPVQLGVMSRCPDALLCETVFNSVLEQVWDKVDLSTVYVAKYDGIYMEFNKSDPEFGMTCPHQREECAGNVQQLCVAKYAEPKQWWSFIQCQNFEGRAAIGRPDVALKCARVAGIDWETSGAGQCAGLDGRGNAAEGVRLLHKSVKLGKTLGIEKSCTILINTRKVCVHDQVWKECEGGHTVNDFVRQINEEYDKLNSNIA
ncbi:hypothetical protein NP233_g8676 [Leucocoprinus birnbaumii]|uniref:Uncharacterized protein n=1 Tax=Leucocoprinus birnbaumii TaxID=56174 RepID=A0AAD5VPB1_9AGAR|nr:hypothetical protein NP233_g8676 [Leucocoprinus birnbaumii]